MSVSTTHAETIDADYLIIGAGATAMAFADSLLSETSATMVIVDRRHRPGGHWNDAYPFVRLHQPSSTYGVNSWPLGTGAIDEVGHNRGMFELASGQEVVSHFDQVMQQRLLPSGRVRFLPMSEVTDDGNVRSLLSGEVTAVRARKIVDATHSRMQIPSTHPPRYEIAPGITCVPVNALPRSAGGHESYVVVGAGKTAMDACIWLLDNGARPDSIRWIMPRDSWLLNRAGFQPGAAFFARAARSLAAQTEAIVEATSIDDVFLRLEAADELRRIDPSVMPTAYHCAVVSDDELAQLRRIRDIVRLGRVTAIETDRIVLERGSVPSGPNPLYIDCSATGIPRLAPRPIFEADRITLQWIRLCQPTFSAALIGFIESTSRDDAEKNRLCQPIAPPEEPIDWLQMMIVELANRQAWGVTPDVADWQAGSRLDGFTSQIRSLTGSETDVMEQLQRYLRSVGPAAIRLPELLATAPHRIE